MAMKSRSAPVEKTTWLTLNAAADYMGVSTNTIRNWRDLGLLHPKKEERVLANGAQRAVMVFDREELERQRPRRDPTEAPTTAGETAARAFELFAKGTSLQEVVMQLRETPQVVEELHDAWYRMGGCELVIIPTAKAALEQLGGPFVGVADLLQILSERLARPETGPA